MRLGNNIWSMFCWILLAGYFSAVEAQTDWPVVVRDSTLPGSGLRTIAGFTADAAGHVTLESLCVEGPLGMSVDGPAVFKGGIYTGFSTTLGIFATIDAPSGTDPVADANADTLTLTATGLTITGDSAADSLAFAVLYANPTATVNGTVVNGSASTAMRSDGAPALADPFTPADGTQNVTGAVAISSTVSATAAFFDPNADTTNITIYGSDEATEIATIGMINGGLLKISTKSGSSTQAGIGLYPEDNLFGVLIYDGTGVTEGTIYLNTYMVNSSPDYVGWHVGIGASTTAGMFLTSAHDMGLGDSSPDAKLEVVGTFMVGSTAAADGDYLSITSASATFGGFIDVSDIEVSTISARDGTEVAVFDNSTGAASFNDNVTLADAAATLLVQGFLDVRENTTLGSGSSDTITPNARWAADLDPSADATRDMGATGLVWDEIYVENIVGESETTGWVVRDQTLTLAGGAISRVREIHYTLENVSGSQTLATFTPTVNTTLIATVDIIANENNGGAAAAYTRRIVYEEDGGLLERVEEVIGTDYEADAAYAVSFAVSGANIVLTVDSSTDTGNWTAVFTITTLNKG